MTRTDLGLGRVEVTGDVPEIGTHARPLPLVESLVAEVAAAGAAVAADHLDRALVQDRALRGEPSSWPWPWARQRRRATLRELEGRVSHRAVGDGNSHLGRRRRQLVHCRLHQIGQRQVRQILRAGLHQDHQVLPGCVVAGSTRRPIYGTKRRLLVRIRFAFCDILLRDNIEMLSRTLNSFQ